MRIAEDQFINFICNINKLRNQITRTYNTICITCDPYLVINEGLPSMEMEF